MKNLAYFEDDLEDLFIINGILFKIVACFMDDVCLNIKIKNIRLTGISARHQEQLEFKLFAILLT